jgi:predicted dehydrogenase
MANTPHPALGVVGLGEPGLQYAEIARNFDCPIVGADANAKDRKRFADEFDVETYDEFEEMYQSGIDAVIVTTPNRYHETAAIPALQADLDVFVEKPLAHNYESAKRIADAADNSDSTCVVGYYLPYYECVEAVKSSIEDGYFGEITHVEGRWIQRRGVPRRGSWYTSKEIAGGGVLQDKGSFLLHLLSHFGYSLTEIDSAMGKARSEFGRRDDYTSVDMWGGQGHENIFDVEDSLSAFMQFTDGRTATIETAWAANVSTKITLKIRGIDGGASLAIGAGELELFGVDRGDPGSLTTTDVQLDYDDEVFSDDEDGPTTSVFRKRVFRRFLECTDGDIPEYCSLGRALDVQRAIEDLYAAVDDSTV